MRIHHGFHRRRVHFERTAEFLAVCASGDTEEAGEMLKEAKEQLVKDINGGIVNCSNADGITALHQVGNCRISGFPVNVFSAFKTYAGRCLFSVISATAACLPASHHLYRQRSSWILFWTNLTHLIALIR